MKVGRVVVVNVVMADPKNEITPPGTGGVISVACCFVAALHDTRRTWNFPGYECYSGYEYNGVHVGLFYEVLLGMQGVRENEGNFRPLWQSWQPASQPTVYQAPG